MVSRRGRKPVLLVLVTVLAAAVATLSLPGMALDTDLADLVVYITDTASWPQLVFVAVAGVASVISRDGIGRHRRRREAAAFGLVLLVFLAGNAALNEYVVKPLVGIPRPNIEQLAESGALGAGFPDAEAFYGVGDKHARRDVLKDRLAAVTVPPLTDRVRAHWAHETGYSLPSGHATAAMTLAVLLAAAGAAWLNGWRRVLTLLVLPMWALAVVYSRVLLEVHAPVDVIMGTMAGFLWGLVAFGMVQWGLGRLDPAPDGGEAVAR